ncbi:polycystin-1-like protein 2 [Branchiostoma floridae x Branchiostoma belcheri]
MAATSTDPKLTTDAPTLPTTSSSTFQGSDMDDLSTPDTMIRPLQEMERLKDLIDQPTDEEISIENVIGVVAEINNLIQLDTTKVSTDGVPPELEEGIALLSKSSELIRSSQGVTLSTMETANNAVAQTVSSVIQNLPAGTNTILDNSSPLFKMNIIDVNSVDVSPKQQLKNIKDQHRTSEQKFRKTALSLVDTIERTADSLLAMLPDTEDYVKTFENDDVIVTVVRSTKNQTVTLQGGQVSVSASLTHCASHGGIDAKMTLMEKNLFAWNASTFGKNITTPVTKFSFRHRRPDGCSMQMNLSNPISFESTEQSRRQKRDLRERGFVGTHSALGDISVEQNGNVTMALHAFDIPADSAVVVMQLSWWDHAAAFRVFFRYDTPPTEELHDDVVIVQEEDVFLAWHRGTRSTRTFTPNIQRRRGRLYIWVQKSGTPTFLQTAPFPKDYVLQAATVSCLSWDHTLEKWQDADCEKQTKVNPANPGSTKVLPLLSVLPPDRMPAPYLYQITVSTGSMFGAGTSARIGFQIFGSKSKTAIKMLNLGGESLLRGGIYDVIMPLKTSLGHLELLQIWHDNTGVDEASWFLRHIIVKDLQTEEVYQFICYDWLSGDRGDFQVQKVLHVATREQLDCFSSLFRENTDAMFYNQHLWTSPFVSPEGSSFTKSERLSCCCAVFSSIMLSNAMWHKSDEGFVTENTVYDLGFVQITLQELYVSLMTVVMVLPVAMVPAKLFRMERTTSITAPGIRRGSNYGLFRERLSRWSKCMAWLLVALVSVVSSFFVILYSLDWGREKSEAWLKAFFLSFGLSSLVAETSQILVLATVFAMICNQRSTDKQKAYNINKEELHVRLWDKKAPKKVYPPSAASAERMKIKNEQRRKFFHVFKDYILLFLFVVVLFFISHHNKDPFAFHASQTLSGTILEDHDSITTADEFWTWTEDILLPVLYPSFWYNGWKMKYLDRQFPLYTEAFKIGPPLLTQVREEPDTMATDRSQKGWMVAKGNGSSACWQFNVTGMMPPNSDCASKYSMELPDLLGLAKAVFSDLQRNDWIDKYTDYLVLELSLYYPAQKLFSSLRLTVKQEDIGHLSTSATVETYRLFQYENASNDIVTLISYIILLVLFVANLVKEVITMKKEGRKFFRKMWNILALASIIGSAAAMCIFGIRYQCTSAALNTLVGATGELGIDHFVNLSPTFWWDEAFKTVLAMVVFITTLSLLRVVRFSKTVASFIALPGVMKNDLIGFSVISTIAFMAFSTSGMLVFGTHMKAYTDVLHANFALFEMLLGRFFAEEILESNRYVGPIFFTIFMILIFILLVNLLVTIICDAIASGAYIADEHDQELADYIWKSFQGVFGIYVPPPEDVTTDELKEIEVKATLQIIEDSLNETLDITSSIWPYAYDTKDEPSSSSDVREQIESLLKAYKEGTVRYEEAQHENKRRVEAMLKRKLAERRKKTQIKPEEDKQTMAQSAQEMIEQHAADKKRLEHQQMMNRRLFQSKLRQKMAARRMYKRDVK